MPPPPGGNAAGAQGQPGRPAGQPGSWQPGNRAGNRRATAGQRPPANKPTPARQRPLTIRYAGGNAAGARRHAGGQCRRRQGQPGRPAGQGNKPTPASQRPLMMRHAEGGVWLRLRSSPALAAAEELAGSGCG